LLLNKYTAPKIKVAPVVNCVDSGVPKSSMLATVATTTLTPVANPLRTLSAYLMTAATNNPPPACNATKIHTHPVKPCQKEFASEDEDDEAS
jgi:hypothetical protein